MFVDNCGNSSCLAIEIYPRTWYYPVVRIYYSAHPLLLGSAPDARKIGNNAFNASRSGKPKFPKKCSRKSGIMPPKFSRAEFSGIFIKPIQIYASLRSASSCSICSRSPTFSQKILFKIAVFWSFGLRGKTSVVV